MTDHNWASKKCREIQRAYVENLLLIELNVWEKPICEFSAGDHEIYAKRKAWLFGPGLLKKTEFDELVDELIDTCGDYK